MSEHWNPWHGCHKKSEGCAHCYVYRIDARHGRDPSTVVRTKTFDAPVQKKRDGSYRIPPGSHIPTCFSSDFLIEEADVWRDAVWQMMRTRSDCHFFVITKRIERLAETVPDDWGDGYPNVQLCCTVENQRRADERLPIYIEAPLHRKIVVCEPLLEAIDLRPYLGPWIEMVSAGGESGPEARECRFEWVQSLQRQCAERGVAFSFKQTGANFVKDGVRYHIPRPQQHPQAKRAGLDTAPAPFEDEGER